MENSSSCVNILSCDRRCVVLECCSLLINFNIFLFGTVFDKKTLVWQKYEVFFLYQTRKFVFLGGNRNLFTQHEIIKSLKTQLCYKYIENVKITSLVCFLFYGLLRAKNGVFSDSQFLVLVFRYLTCVKLPEFIIQRRLKEVSDF